MIGDWRVRNLPLCTHHVFLSHCAEDRDRLVKPLFLALQNAKYSPWFDRHHYPAGQGAFEALREAIAGCRHVVFLETAKFLGQGRGWNSVEMAYSTLLQECLREQALELCHVQLPLFFVPQNHAILHRSAWAPITARGQFYPRGQVDNGAVAWATQKIQAFINQEQIRGQSLAIQLQNDPAFASRLAAEPHLLRRVMCVDPP